MYVIGVVEKIYASMKSSINNTIHSKVTKGGTLSYLRRTIIADVVQGILASDYLINGSGWQGWAPVGVNQIYSPNHTVLLIGGCLLKEEAT
jgi:hypothetical protein